MPGNIDTSRLLDDRSRDGNWLTAGNDWQGSYHSPLVAINADNAGRMGFAWQYDLQATRGQEATPVVVDGVMYASTNWGRVVAVDAETGKERWTYDPEVDGQWGRYACCDVVNRGLSVWKGVIYVGSTDNYLHAIDAATGKRRWKVDTLDPADRRTHVPYTTSGMPQVAGDVVVIGNGGADFGVRGFVRGYDLGTGARRWTFYTVPHDPKTGPQEKPYLEAALKTWHPQSDWRYKGGGTAWDGMAYDPRLGLLFVGTGNASPYNYQKRSKGKGDNLYLASIVAIDPATGDLKWHYQTVPGDAWDYTATMKFILADLKVDGRVRQVIMQAPKNGYFYVLDRKTGALITAKPYTRLNWSTGINPATGRAIVSPVADYASGPKLIYPSMAGGHNWNPMAFNPATGLVYIPVIDAPMVFVDTSKRPVGSAKGTFDVFGLFPDGYDPKALAPLFGDMPTMAQLTKVAGGPIRPAVRAAIRAFDPVKGRVVWETPTPDIKDGGIMTTAGNLVISGTVGGQINIRRADNGTLLKSIETGRSIMAAPMTYAIGGVQYVAVLTGIGGGGSFSFGPETAAFKYGNAGRILVFRLDGSAVPMPDRVAPPQFETPPKPPAFTDAKAARGEILFIRNCAACHGNGPGLVPDLRRISNETHAIFNDIVLGGMYAPNGMGSFSDVLSAAETDAIHAYLSREQLALYNAERGNAGPRPATAPSITH